MASRFWVGEDIKTLVKRYLFIDRITRAGTSFFSLNIVRRVFYFACLLFFFILVLLPTLWVLTSLFTEWNVIYNEVILNPGSMSTIIRSLGLSVAVSITIAIIDVIFGFPMAWILIRRDFRGKSALAAFIDAPLAVPTAGLGFSVALFWALTPGVANKPFFSLNFVSSPFLLLVLFHFTTTFPLMVKALAAILEEIDRNLEIAGLTCGAKKLTVIRTITLPLFRAGLATGLILVFAKSLSDTGGVVTLLTTLKGFDLTTEDTISGTVLIDIWKHPPNGAPPYLPGLSMVAILMILISITLLVLVNLIAMKAKFNIRKVWTPMEASLSKGAAPKTYNTLTFLFFLFLVQVPAFFIFSYIFVGTPSQNVNITEFLGAVMTSFFVGGMATGIGLLFGVPIAILITRSNNKWFSSLMDTIVNVPYIIPSAALGLSVSFFWNSFFLTLTGSNIPPSAELVLVVLSHVAMTIPYIIRNTVGAMTELDTTYEEMARSLGAKPFQVFSRVTFPAIVPAVVAGSIMAFTRSVGETGATSSVSDPQNVLTAPILIVGYVKGHLYFEAALTTIILIGCSLVLLLLVAKMSQKSRRRKE
ncbi:MAG: ABC transporter permease [Candidatus Odinarchaeota archaeon]